MEQLGLELAPQRQVFTVSEATALVREVLEGTFSDVWILGEISNAKRAPSGHHYFTLKDREAQIRCVCFRLNARYLKVKPHDGLAVVARGRISVYEARGEYQLYVEHLEPQGHGALRLAFEQLKEKLAAEGLFEEHRKRPLPEVPRRIGIVTSPRGAVISDMLRILQRRFEGLHIVLYPVQVQGQGAARQIVEGLTYFSRTKSVDVVIVGRGGGSLEDLWAFNEEPVARAIVGSTVPVISAVGHQTDFTISDFVADLRVPTPSAAAELVVKQKRECMERVQGLEGRLAQVLRYKLATSGRQLLEANVERTVMLVRQRIARRAQRSDELSFSLRRYIASHLKAASKRLSEAQHALAGLDLRVRLARHRSRLHHLGERLFPLMNQRLARLEVKRDSLERQLRQLSPLAILERGFSIVQTPEGAIVRSSAETAVGKPLRIRLHEGRLEVKVERKA